MGINAFQKTGNTVTFIAAVSAPSPVQAASTTLGGNQYRIINSGTTVAFLGYGVDAANATSSAVTVTSTQPAFPLLPGTDEILTFIPNAYFTAVSSTSATIYITPGDGV